MGKNKLTRHRKERAAVAGCLPPRSNGIEDTGHRGFLEILTRDREKGWWVGGGGRKRRIEGRVSEEKGEWMRSGSVAKGSGAEMDEGNKHGRGFISVSPDIYPLSGYKVHEKNRGPDIRGHLKQAQTEATTLTKVPQPSRPILLSFRLFLPQMCLSNLSLSLSPSYSSSTKIYLHHSCINKRSHSGQKVKQYLSSIYSLRLPLCSLCHYISCHVFSLFLLLFLLSPVTPTVEILPIFHPRCPFLSSVSPLVLIYVTVKMWLSSGADLISWSLFYCLRALNPFSFYCYHIFLNFFLLTPCTFLNLLLPSIHLISAHTSFPLPPWHKTIKLSCQRPCINPFYISEAP